MQPPYLASIWMGGCVIYVCICIWELCKEEMQNRTLGFLYQEGFYQQVKKLTHKERILLAHNSSAENTFCLQRVLKTQYFLVYTSHCANTIFTARKYVTEYFKNLFGEASPCSLGHANLSSHKLFPWCSMRCHCLNKKQLFFIVCYSQCDESAL